MTNILSDWAREFLREDHVAVGSTLNKDGSPFVTTIWYLLQEDGTVIYHLFWLIHSFGETTGACFERDRQRMIYSS
jgi:hypothetical protein